MNRSISSPTHFFGPGDEAIHTVHGFLVFRTATLRAGGRPIAVPECNYTADVDAILSGVTPRTKIVFLANRNNPTGTCVPFEEIKRLRRHLAPEVLLVLHAAYAERCNKLQTGSQSSACPIALSVLSKIGDLSALPDLTNQDLEKLGVLLGDRRKMLRAIRELGDVSVAASVSSAAAATELTRRDEAERRR